MNKSKSNNKEMKNIDRSERLKTIFYILILFILLFVSHFVFGWKTLEEIPSFLKPYSTIILWINPYLKYIQAVLIFIFGYLMINVISSLIYRHFIKIADHPTAAAIRSIFKISGITVLLSIFASLFNVNAAAALTVGSFGGLVVGFATQTILSNVVAGVFLLLTRPFIYGDLISVSGQTGLVKEIKLMHLVLESEDGKKDILIPSGSVVTQVIQKKKPSKKLKPFSTVLSLNPPPSTVLMGSKIEFIGKLIEHDTGEPIPDMSIRLYESDMALDDLIVSGKTDDNGEYKIEWKAKKLDWGDGTIEVYARFEGNADYRESRSSQYEIKLIRSKTSQ
jgi:hypothetical protein